MKTRRPSSSAFAQTGWNFSGASSSPLTLPPTDNPRRPYFLTPSTNCSTARSGCCSATVAKATNRSGCAAQILASPSFWIVMILLAVSRSALYQNGLMLSASTSMPCASITWMRSWMDDRPSSGGFGFTPISAIASGMAQWQCTSTVFTRRPFTTTSRRRVCACVGAAPMRLQPTNATPPIAPAPLRISLRVTIFVLLPTSWLDCFEWRRGYTNFKPECHFFRAGSARQRDALPPPGVAVNLREPHRREQKRHPGICPCIDAGQLLDAIEPEINGVGVDAQTLRGPLDVEIAVCESTDRAQERARLVAVALAEMPDPFGDQTNGRIVRTPEQKVRQLDIGKVHERSAGA